MITAKGQQVFGYVNLAINNTRGIGPYLSTGPSGIDYRINFCFKIRYSQIVLGSFKIILLLYRTRLNIDREKL